MATRKLTARTVEAAQSGERAVVIYDTDLKGFGVRVMPSGSKSWIVEYRPAASGRTGNKKRMSLGSTSTVTATQARTRAKDILGAVRGGADPLGDRAADRATATVAELVERFLVDHVERRRKASTVSLYRTAARLYIVPAIGRKKAIDVGESDVLRLHGSLADKPTMANRVVAVLSSAFSWGGKAGHIPKGVNPAAGVERNRENKRERYLSPAEIGRLGEALREAETTGIPQDGKAPFVIGPHATAAIRLLILTGCRLREILRLRWADVDLERGWLWLPDSKTGKKPVALNAPASAILASLDRIGPFVCPGRPMKGGAEKPRNDLKRPWAAIRDRAGLEGTRIHDLRHSFASTAAGAGLGLPVIGKLLGHSQASTTQRYAHLADDPLKRASEAIGATIAASLDKHESSGDVVAINQGKRRA